MGPNRHIDFETDTTGGILRPPYQSGLDSSTIRFLINKGIAEDEKSALVLVIAFIVCLILLSTAILFFMVNDANEVPPSAVPQEQLVS